MPCPIGLDCSFMPADKHSNCLNLSYCKGLTNPWPLPYTISDGLFRVLITGLTHSPEQIRELNAYGWGMAVDLPYYFDNGLIVWSNCLLLGFAVAWPIDKNDEADEWNPIEDCDFKFEQELASLVDDGGVFGGLYVGEDGYVEM